MPARGVFMALVVEPDRLKVIEELKRREFVPYNVIGIIENTSDELRFDEETGAVWVSHGYFNYVTGNQSVIVRHLDSLDDGFYGFSAVEGGLAEAIYEGRFLHWCEPTERYVFGNPSAEFDAMLEKCPYEVVRISLDEAEGIDERYEYQQEGSLDRIRDAILNRPTAAIYIEGAIASYVLVHEDNSIGYMFTLEAHRHKGLGYWVTLDLLRQMKANGKVSFVEITKKNFKSQGLAAKTGFIRDAYTPWFGIIKGFPEWFKTWDPFEGQSFYYSSLAQIRMVDGLTWQGVHMDFEKIGDGYQVRSKVGERDAYTSFTMIPEDTKEAYVLTLTDRCEHTLYEVLCMIADGFPEQNASLIVKSEKSLEDWIGGFFIKR